MEKKVLIYGSYGYTGKLITALVKKEGWKAVLAGRNRDKLAAMAGEYAFDYHCFGLEDRASLNESLEQCELVIHCAGPFSRTAIPMVQACLQSGTHYLDITGEIEVFEKLKQFDEEARAAGIMIMPGTGFDVVPSDCLANYLKASLPAATDLKLALLTHGGKLSHGTATTVVENLGEGGAVRRNGKLRKVPHAHLVERFDFGFGNYTGMSIPWGDLSTAWTSTAIPNITVYNCLPSKVIQASKRMNYFKWLLKTRFVQSMMKRQVDKRPAGPSEEQRANAKSYVWGEVSDENSVHRALLHLPDGYSLTAMTAVHIAGKVLQSDFKAGYQTPAMAYGAKLILEIEGVKREDLAIS